MQPQAIKQSKDLGEEEQTVGVENDGDRIDQGWYLPETDFQWAKVDKVVETRDTAMNLVFEKTQELEECLDEFKFKYAELRD